MAGILLFGFGVQWYLVAIIAAVCVALLYFPDRFYTFGVLAIAAGWFVPRYMPRLHCLRACTAAM